MIPRSPLVITFGGGVVVVASGTLVVVVAGDKVVVVMGVVVVAVVPMASPPGPDPQAVRIKATSVKKTFCFITH
jgi:hypothetical protein